MIGPTEQSQFRIDFARRTFGRILDCGSGPGVYQQYFGSKDIVSLDALFSQLETVPGTKVCADAGRLPFKDNTFDCVWSCGVIQYIDVPIEAFLKEWVRVCKPGGKIYILTPNRPSLIDWMKVRLGMKGWASQGPVKKLYSYSELSRFGKVYGEIRFLSWLNKFLWVCPVMAHTIMLEIDITKDCAL